MDAYRTGCHDGPLPAEFLTPASLIGPRHGAVASFLGVVRDHSRGGIPDGPYRPVLALHYQCYRPMAEKMLVALAAEAARDHDPDLRALVIHAVGDLRPGDVSVAIHIASRHRAAAFAACRQVIERIKEDLPVWKREHYADGDPVWLKGS